MLCIHTYPCLLPLSFLNLDVLDRLNEKMIQEAKYLQASEMKDPLTTVEATFSKRHP